MLAWSICIGRPLDGRTLEQTSGVRKSNLQTPPTYVRESLNMRPKSQRLFLDRRGDRLFFRALDGRVEHVAVHPVEQRFVLGAPVADRSDHGSAVRRVRETEHLGRYAVHAQHREELLRLLRGAAVVA